MYNGNTLNKINFKHTGINKNLILLTEKLTIVSYILILFNCN